MPGRSSTCTWRRDRFCRWSGLTASEWTRPDPYLVSNFLGKCHETGRRIIGAMTSVNAAILPEILRRIVDAYSPSQVYLFGSEARGDAGDDSDIDLAVIVRDNAPAQQTNPRTAAEALWGLERGADVVVFREGEFAARRNVISSLPWTICREGKLLYGR